MRKLTRILVAVLALLSLWSVDSHAVGIGVAVDGSTGSGDAEWEHDFDSWDIDMRSAGFGFVLDTAPMDERVFNYRLNVGFAAQKFETDDDISMTGKGLYVENTFGFAPVQRPEFRWWLGPLVRVGFFSGDSDTYQTFDGASRADFHYVELGIGGVTGMNFKVGSAILSPSIGVRYSSFTGEADIETRFPGGGGYSYREDIDGQTTNVFANFAVLF